MFADISVVEEFSVRMHPTVGMGRVNVLGPHPRYCCKDMISKATALTLGRVSVTRKSITWAIGSNVELTDEVDVDEETKLKLEETELGEVDVEEGVDVEPDILANITVVEEFPVRIHPEVGMGRMKVVGPHPRHCCKDIISKATALTLGRVSVTRKSIT